MITEYDIVHTLVRTEKGSMLETDRKYIFQVSTRANKIAIKRAVESIYNVKVQDVNCLVVPGKRKRVRQEFGHTSKWKGVRSISLSIDRGRLLWEFEGLNRQLMA